MSTYERNNNNNTYYNIILRRTRPNGEFIRLAIKSLSISKHFRRRVVFIFYARWKFGKNEKFVKFFLQTLSEEKNQLVFDFVLRLYRFIGETIIIRFEQA